MKIISRHSKEAASLIEKLKIEEIGTDRIIEIEEMTDSDIEAEADNFIRFNVLLDKFTGYIYGNTCIITDGINRRADGEVIKTIKWLYEQLSKGRLYIIDIEDIDGSVIFSSGVIHSLYKIKEII